MADDVFPYPPDDPDEIAQRGRTFWQFAADLATLSADVNCGARVFDGSRSPVDTTMIEAAAEAMGRMHRTLRAYAVAIEHARADIDTLRQEYREATGSGVAALLQPIEMANWSEFVHGLYRAYGEIMSKLNTAARATRAELEAIATTVGGQRVPLDASQVDIERAIAAVRAAAVKPDNDVTAPLPRSYPRGRGSLRTFTDGVGFATRSLMWLGT